jgi:hypothetical protein
MKDISRKLSTVKERWYMRMGTSMKDLGRMIKNMDREK